MIAAVPLMVNEVEIFARSMPSNSVSISDRLRAAIRRPCRFPAAPSGRPGRSRIASADRARRIGRSAPDRAGTVALVGFFGGTEAGILADGPQAPAVAVGEDAARKRILAGSPGPGSPAISRVTTTGTSIPDGVVTRFSGCVCGAPGLGTALIFLPPCSECFSPPASAPRGTRRARTDRGRAGRSRRAPFPVSARRTAT